MKDFFLETCLKIVRSSFLHYTEETLDVIKYGLEALYLTITKMLVFFFLSIILGTFKETVLFCLFFGVLRTTGFGIHANDSFMCWLSSSIVFLGIPFLCKNMIFSSKTLLIISVLCEINLLTFAPADTKKKPLLQRKRRIICKFITAINGAMYVGYILLSKNFGIKSVMFFAMLTESVLVNPLTYKFFNHQYNNYKGYVYNT